MVLAGDIGGTKTLLGLFDPEGDRPKPLVVREYATLDFDSLGELMQVFLEDTGAGASVTAVAVGVAGPVTGLVARLTKVPWVVDASVLGEQPHREGAHHPPQLASHQRLVRGRVGILQYP
jgi:glucokinase